MNKSASVEYETTESLPLEFKDNALLAQLAGEHNANLRIIERALDVRIHLRGNQLTLQGSPHDVDVASRVLKELYSLLEAGLPIYPSDVESAIQIISANDRTRLKDIFLDQIYITSRKRIITPKSIAQKKYIDAIRSNDIVFGIGPAGTGKTYLAMAMAVSTLVAKKVGRIILVRPAVEAGEKLGFLPGDLVEKVNPYLRPLYDALYDMMDLEQASKLVQRGVIEVAPLAFMRGRTLNDSFVILDEGQNTTSDQMKMFLTRLGATSKAVITGDITQIDLPNGKVSGLIEAKDLLKGIKGIEFVFFSEKDVVRHRLVQEIIKAYEAKDKEKKREG
ncbi:MAG TPA: PhoH family protein [Deltaproteobacteria bacterium]|nr:MAG: phosphate starvation-inducible protein PhoH [Deltaproteobacteria bacterium]HEC31055.1 PhoH family protein [Deltaproteobacteria bacterium]